MTAAQTIADALRIRCADIDATIFKVRRLHSEGKSAPKTAARYVAAVRAAHELREKAVALGVTGALVEDVQPLPFRNQLVGLSASERAALEWLGAGDFFGGRTVTEIRIAA